VNTRSCLEKFFAVKTLEGFGHFHDLEHRAAGALLDYVLLTQGTARPAIARPRQISSERFMKLDPFTRRNLELTHTLDGGTQRSLLALMDRTLTPGGGRLLRLFFQNPLKEAEAIQSRLDRVDFFFAHPAVTQGLRDLLKTCPDLERPLGRLALGRGGPRDLGMIRQVLKSVQALDTLLSPLVALLPQGLAKELEALRDALVIKEEALDFLEEGLQESPFLELPPTCQEGGFVRPKYNLELDHWRALSSETEQFLESLENRYRQETHIATLKVRENNLIGVYIEISQGQLSKVPATFTLKQKLTQGARYVTSELLEWHAKCRDAGAQGMAMEQTIFQTWVQRLAANQEALQRLAQALASLDVFTSLAHLAREKKYTKPVLTLTNRLCIEKGFHPVVKDMMEKEGSIPFISNTCILGEKDFAWLITGPNMAGKSTFLRQTALIVLMAQMGSFVPAQHAEIGVCDRIFSRIGAGDNLAGGASTFMTEMVEAATILHQATSQSLVILDELGRGTSTHDGLALAWACFEYLVKQYQCRTLFATHYHELTAMEGIVPGVICYTPQVKEWQDEIVFMHAMIPEKAKGSYGLHVARLAGIPSSVLQRAQEIQDERAQEEGLPGGLPLFLPPAFPPSPSSATLETEAYLRTLNLSQISPREALNILYDLQTQLHSAKDGPACSVTQ